MIFSIITKEASNPLLESLKNFIFKKMLYSNLIKKINYKN